MTNKEMAFVECYIETGDSTQAALDAGYSEHTAQVQGYQLKKRLVEEIDLALRASMKHKSSSMMKIIEGIAKNSQQDAVKLKAAQDILNRAGYAPAQKIEDVTQTKSYEEMLRDLEDQAGENAPEVMRLLGITDHKAPDTMQ